MAGPETPAVSPAPCAAASSSAAFSAATASIARSMPSCACTSGRGAAARSGATSLSFSWSACAGLERVPFSTSIRTSVFSGLAGARSAAAGPARFVLDAFRASSASSACSCSISFAVNSRSASSGASSAVLKPNAVVASRRLLKRFSSGSSPKLYCSGAREKSARPQRRQRQQTTVERRVCAQVQGRTNSSFLPSLIHTIAEAYAADTN